MRKNHYYYLLFLAALGFGMFLVNINIPFARADAPNFNKAPTALKGSWQTKIHKTANKYSNKRNRYWFSSLYVTNKQFHLEDFMLNKHKGNEYNSGPYGAYKGKTDSLAFRKTKNRHYNIYGNIAPDVEKGVWGYSVVLSKNNRSMKVYSHKLTDYGSYYTFGKKHYIGNFYKK